MQPQFTEFQHDVVYNLLQEELEYYTDETDYFSQNYVKEINQIIDLPDLIEHKLVQDLLKDVVHNLNYAKTTEKLKPKPNIQMLNQLQKEIDHYQSVIIKS